jgi:hypothetical protein
MTSLNALVLNNNQLTGSIPPDLGKLKNLTILDLGTNLLTGPIPPELGSLSSLATLYLTNNMLSGSIPQELSNLKNLTSLYLATNNLTGSLPGSLAKLPKISYIAINGNRLTGILPIELAYISTLRNVLVNDNLFQFSSLGGSTDYYSFTLTYQPQKKIGREQQVALQAGESYLLEVPDYSAYTNDALQWWKNGSTIAGATQTTYNISVFDAPSMKGDYYLEVKNPKYPDLTIQSNMVSVRQAVNTDILGVLFSAQTKTPLIVYDSAKVYVDLAYGTNITSLSPSIRIPTGSFISPASGTAQNFTSPVSYTVANGIDTRVWQIRVRVNPNDKADITGVTLTGSVGTPVINTSTNYVELHIPYGNDPEKLAPTFTVSPGAKMYPSSGTVRDFTIPVYYTVSAQDGTNQKVWKVAVIVNANTKSGIEDVILSQQTKSAVIDNEKHIVYCEVPYGTDYSVLKPVIKTSPGATIDAVNIAKSYGIASEYLITSQDSSSTTSWQIVVSMAANTKADILGFMLSGQQGVVIDKETKTISVSVKKFQDLSVAMPLILVSDFASISPGSGVPVNLKDTVWYVVKAQDGIHTSKWKVVTNIVTGTEDASELRFAAYPNPAKDKLFIELPEGKHTITLIGLSGKPEKEVEVAQAGVVEIDLSGLAKGAWLLRIESSKEIQTSVILKQ